MKTQAIKELGLDRSHDLRKVRLVGNIWRAWTFRNLLAREILGKLLECAVKLPRRPKMWAVISVVCGFWMIDDPLRVVSCVVKHDIHHTKQALRSQAIQGAFQFSKSLLAGHARWRIEVDVIDSCLVGKRVVTVRFTVGLEGREVDGVVAQLPDISQDRWPSTHLSKATRHHSKEAEFFTSDEARIGGHDWLDVDVLWLCVRNATTITFVFVNDLHKEASTHVE